MKNKIFELYKPNSLTEFLDFYKKNPEERFVYVVHQPAPNIKTTTTCKRFYFYFIFYTHCYPF